jgi:hypothetical protein
MEFATFDTWMNETFTLVSCSVENIEVLRSTYRPSDITSFRRMYLYIREDCDSDISHIT